MPNLHRIAIHRSRAAPSEAARCGSCACEFVLVWNTRRGVSVSLGDAPPLHLRARQLWLRQAMRGTWRELNDLAPAGSPDYLAWRQTLLESLDRLPQESVVFSHFIAINVAVAAALSRENVVCFWPDHASVTCVQAGNGSLRLVKLGRQAETTVLAGG
jgi:hypothetical protein